MKRAVFTTIGVIYGAVLLACGFVLAGYGEGVLVPFGIFSSPIVILNVLIPSGADYQSFAITIFFLGILILWGYAGWLSASLTGRSARRRLLVLLAIHYLALPVVFHDNDFGDWGRLSQVWDAEWGVLLAGFSIYFAGQATLWVLLLRHIASARRVLSGDLDWIRPQIKVRPTIVSIIAWLLVVGSGINLCWTLFDLYNPSLSELIARRSLLPTQVQYFEMYATAWAGIVIGLGMLLGRNWARIAYVIVGPVNWLLVSITSLLPGLSTTISGAIFALTILALFYPNANQYFLAEAEPSNLSLR